MAVRATGMGGPFVGRQRELAVLADVLAVEDRTGVALIGGEAGMGKTRLLDEAVDHRTGLTVMRGAAVPRTTPLPFELVRSALGPAVEPVDPGRTDPAAAAALGSRRAPDDGAVPAVNEQVRAVAELLRQTGTMPVCFIFDDIHWADPESLDVIERLVVAGPMDATILVTYRPEALRPRQHVAAFLDRVSRRPHAVHVRLEPLRRDDLASYLTQVGMEFDDGTVEALHSRTGGNALFVAEVVAAASGTDALTGGLPWTLAEILRPEIDRLPDELRAVADVVAVLGADASFDLVAAAADVGEDELLARLRRLVDAEILVESDPDRFGFRHELVREAVVDGLFARERRRIHAAAHDALIETESDDEVALVTHAAEAGRFKEAADTARAAAVAALARGSSHQALAFADQALLVHNDDIDLLRVAVSAGWMSSQYPVALDHLARWEELAGSDPEMRAEPLHWRIRVLWEMGDGEAADRAAAELAEVTESLTGRLLAQALADLAQHLMLSGKHTRAVEVADRALVVAEEFDAHQAALQARTERASALLGLPEHRLEAVGELDSLAHAAERIGDWVTASRALNNVPVLATGPDPRRHLERVRSASRRAGLTCIASHGYRLALLEVAEAEGDRDEYEALLEAAMADLGDHPLVVESAVRFRLGTGDTEEASRLIDRLEGLRSSPHSSARDRAGWRALLDLIEAGSPEAVRRWMADDIPAGARTQMVVESSDELITAGLREPLSNHLQVLAVASRAGCHHEPVVDGLTAELDGRLDEADRVYASAIDAGQRGVLMLAELGVARARVATARGDDPAPHLRSARAMLDRWPGRLRDRIDGRLGDESTPADSSAPGGLTRREKEVARLVSRGLTNGGIAEELFISTKTASVHVSNILAKLSMSSRAEIAAWVARGALDA